MKKLAFVTMILFTMCINSVDAQMYIVTDTPYATGYSPVDTVYVTSPTGLVTKYEIAYFYDEQALHDSQLNVILNSVINFGYTLQHISEDVYHRRTFYFLKP